MLFNILLFGLEYGYLIYLICVIFLKSIRKYKLRKNLIFLIYVKYEKRNLRQLFFKLLSKINNTENNMYNEINLK